MGWCLYFGDFCGFVTTTVKVTDLSASRQHFWDCYHSEPFRDFGVFWQAWYDTCVNLALLRLFNAWSVLLVLYCVLSMTCAFSFWFFLLIYMGWWIILRKFLCGCVLIFAEHGHEHFTQVWSFTSSFQISIKMLFFSMIKFQMHLV